MRGRHRVHSDHPVHLGITLDASYETAPELPGHPGHEHDLAQDQRLPSVAALPRPSSAPPGSRRHVSGSMLRCDDRAMQEVTTATDVRTDRGRQDVALRSHTTPRNRPHKARGTTVAPPPDGGGATERACCSGRLLLVATLHAGALQQLAVLLLGHPLTPLLDNRAHDYPRSLLFTRCGASGPTRPTSA